ncbi:CBS domain-containing protein [Dyella lutea]|uniref:CBS domain-containing protein n=1 Tax=Dyella lutea TaxID=2950441 RepID=A0ABT1FD08_9GAMM|nr:CBS domain-containing protein [Dyella lutea]MCP1375263.1 CBS domain-containing protein [Dyella lutea]
MHAAEICTRHVVYIDRKASIREAAQSMRSHHVGALVITDQPNGERVPAGIITDRDIAIAVVAAGIQPENLMVEDVMNRNVATCAESEDLFDIITTMLARSVRRLPVVNDKGGLVGMVSSDDLYGALSTHLRMLSQALAREQVREMEVRV